MTLRVLFLTCHLPYPPVSGGRRREFELLRRIAEDVDVSVCAVTKTLDEDLRNASALLQYCSDVQVLPAEPLRSAETSMPFQVLRHRSRHVTPALAHADYDLIHVEGFYLMQHLRSLGRRPTVLVEQNIEYELWQQRAAHTTGAAAWRNRREAERTRRAEREAWRRADVVGALTTEDRDVIRAAGIPRVHLVPDGIDIPARPPVRTPADAPPILTYVANFGYEPNVDAAVYFVQSVLPSVIRSVPDAHLMLVGNAPPPEVQALAGPSVTVTGRVPDVGEYLTSATVVVCPLRIGGGVKVKMLEALAYGKAIVSTPVGVQGFGADASTAVAVTHRAAEMSAAIVDLIRDVPRRNRLEAAAAQLAASLPTWDDAAASLLDCYHQAAGHRQRQDA